METIQSTDNTKLKHIKKLLTDKAYRYDCRAYVAEGERWIFDALNFAPSHFISCFVKESCADKFGALLVAAEAVVGAENIFAVADRVFDKLSDTGQSQGILAVLKIVPHDGMQGCPVLFLDGISDPGNLGTMIRTAVAAGFCDVILHDCTDVYAPKVVRSSMNALVRANIMRIKSATLIGFLQENGYTVFAADMGGENIFTIREKFDKIVLIVGGEAEGIRPELLKLADRIVAIPMKNMESLNAAVSAGILMYQLTCGK